MTTDLRAPFPAPPWDRVVAIAGAAIVAVVVAVAAIVAVPPSVANLQATVSDGREAVDAASADVVVPAGWIVSRGVDGLTVRTPDGGLAVRLAGDAGDDPRAALRETLERDLGAVPTATVGPVRTETLASGLVVVHADVGADAVYAVVGVGHDRVVRVVARAAAGRDLTDYRPALGRLLEGIAP